MTKRLACWNLVVSILTLFVLFLTLRAANRYAKEAHKQNALLSRSIKEQVEVSRPVVISNRITATTVINNIPLLAHVVFVNFGKSVALNLGTPGELVLQDSNAATPVDPRCNKQGSLPKDVPTTALAVVDALGDKDHSLYPRDWNLRSNEDLSATAGKTLYGTGCAYYKGLDGESYFSDVCVIWSGGAFVACTDPKRNHVR